MANGVWPAGKKMPLMPVSQDDDLPPAKGAEPIFACGGVEHEYRPGDMSVSEDWLDDVGEAGKQDLQE